jgi:hypothetical protein
VREYDHYQAMREFRQARKNGDPLTIASSPTFSGHLSSATHVNHTPAAAPQPQGSSSSTASSSMSPPAMQPTHSYGYGAQQPSQTGPIRTSTTRGGYHNQVPPRRHMTPRFQSMPATPSPTTPSYANNDYTQGRHPSGSNYDQDNYNQGPSQGGANYSQGSSSSNYYNQNRTSPATPVLSRQDYRGPQLPPPNQLSPFQYPCTLPEVRGESSRGESSTRSTQRDTTSEMPPPTHPHPNPPSRATEPGSAALPPPVPTQSRRPPLSLSNTHATAFERPTHFPTPAHTPMTGPGPSFPVPRSTPSPALRAHALATPPSTVPTPQLTRSTTLSTSRSPTPATTPAQGNSMLNMPPDQVATHLQILAAHVGLDVHFTPKPSRRSTERSKSGLSATPEPRRSMTPKLSPPGTSSGKSSRRASFATMLPSARPAPAKRSRPGQWTLEKRLIFVDRLITAGYKSLSLSDLAEEVSLVHEHADTSSSSRRSSSSTSSPPAARAASASCA